MGGTKSARADGRGKGEMDQVKVSIHDSAGIEYSRYYFFSFFYYSLFDYLGGYGGEK
jgi:hypothetical protein